MDDAVDNARRYYERFEGKRTAVQLWYRICSVAKRLSKAHAAGNRESFEGSLLDLEIFSLCYSTKPDSEQMAIVQQMLGRLSDRSREIAYWRLAGHSWEQIAEWLGSNHMAVRRVLHREINRLLFPTSGSDKEENKGNGY
jgi:DNA-directed RNA polymerase specialized sigma24 family protein